MGKRKKSKKQGNKNESNGNQPLFPPQTTEIQDESNQEQNKPLQPLLTPFPVPKQRSKNKAFFAFSMAAALRSMIGNPNDSPKPTATPPMSTTGTTTDQN